MQLTRSPLSFATSTRSLGPASFTPSRVDRTCFLETEPLAGVYLAVVESELGARRASSGISLHAFDAMVASAWKTMTLAVSDDPSAFDPSDEKFNPSGGNVVSLSTARAPQYDERFVYNWLGSIEVASLASLSHIARVGATSEGQGAIVQVRDDNLTLGGFDILECRLAFRVENRGPRRLYPR
jgi:hypothetical protein